MKMGRKVKPYVPQIKIKVQRTEISQTRGLNLLKYIRETGRIKAMVATLLAILKAKKIKVKYLLGRSREMWRKNINAIRVEIKSVVNRCPWARRLISVKDKK